VAWTTTFFTAESMVNADRKLDSQDRMQHDAPSTAFGQSPHSLLASVLLGPVEPTLKSAMVTETLVIPG